MLKPKKPKLSFFIHELLDFRVVDGDTVECLLYLGGGITRQSMVRLDGIDAPELHSDNKLEVKAADRVASVVSSILWKDLNLGEHSVTVEIEEKHDARGRLLGDIIVGVGFSLTNVLLGLKIVRAYDGKKARTAWDDKQLEEIILNCDEYLSKNI